MEAAGLASSILTFIDICYKVAKRTYEIYESATGATAENIHVGNVIIDLEKAAAELSPASRGHDAELAKLSEQCRTLSDDLLKLLAGLERREKRLFQSFKAAIAGARKQKEVASIEKRLDQYRQQIILHLTLNIYRDQSPIKAQLERIRDDSSRLENEHAAKLDALHNQLSELLERMRTTSSRQFWDQQVSNDRDFIKTLSPPVNELDQDEFFGKASHKIHAANEPSTHNIQYHAIVGNDLRDLARLLHDFKLCASTLEAENKTLDSLYFDAIFQRENSVSDAVSNTFAWIVDGFPPSTTLDSTDTNGSNSPRESRRSSFSSSPKSEEEELVDHHRIALEKQLLEETQNREAMSQSLHSFLADEGEVFFVCGKAGSGKSTLMKFLSHHSSVRETLVDCASKRKLVIVNTFFWSSGDPLQKSLEGFYRAVLFHTLRQCPELLETVIPTLTGIGFSPLSAAISLSELEAAFSRLQSLENAASYLFCYFIDGLDEYEGDPLDQKHLAEMLRKWSRKDNVKIICSARPSTVTLDIFGASKTFFELHKLTKADIHAFAEDQIKKYLSEPTFEKGQAELAVVVCGNQQHSPPFLSQNILIPKSKQQEKMGPTVWEPFSFLHFAATYGMAQYVKTTVASMDNPTIVDTSNVNLLITAAYSSVPALVDFLLQEGWHPNELVTACGLKSSLKGERCFVSVWEAFLYRVACLLSAFCADESRTPVWKVRNRESMEHLNDTFSMVESFLQSGADAEVEILGVFFPDCSVSSTEKCGGTPNPISEAEAECSRQNIGSYDNAEP
ncbi:hypothetical protein CTAM01_13867 [Colletotrichum tamarilloi]|uniref:Nephrocystin 3-like N-terminal domain-containing protein n=1 Tax=Colletotrichum tamarilloi TaxID=1209934 RepID=A0ABQ9QQT8_9PEZI|nr:uncharacterized protein CTAM01_13867 [Colletotrichum tamarilloi]KAK1481707.1 hypothetical protein CTAM01_13867 [Colletotrichum tamarilloi]